MAFSSLANPALIARQAGDIEGYCSALKASYALPDSDFTRLYSHHLLPNSSPPTSIDPAVREIFASHNYTYESARTYLSKIPPSELEGDPLPDILDAGYFHLVRDLLPPPTDATEVLLSLFLFGISLPAPTISAALPQLSVFLLTSSTLLLNPPHSPTHVLSPYQIYPLSTALFNALNKPSTILLATDWSLESLIPPKFAIMPIGQDTLELIAVHTSDPSPANPPRVLDMCSGSGAQGITYKLTTCPSCELTMVDVNPRAVKMCELNKLLNNVEGRVVQGACWEPLDEDEKFGRILCNPPFVAVPDPQPQTNIYDQPSLYATGGPKGDEVLRSILRPLQTRLTETGRFYCVTEVQNVKSR